MASGYKHFSHPHNLVVHEIPEGVEVSCSGCNSSAIKTVYVCWQCNFYLHEQCFHATRSRKHPSHPLHPLNLVPYPTYPSNSFYCNSCKIIGTGFSYSCSECNFDLHVQCAYSISSATNFHQSYSISYPNQEILPPQFYNQNSSVSIPVPTPIPNPVQVHAQYPTNSLPIQTPAIPTPLPVHAQYPGHDQYPTNSFPIQTPAIPTPVPVHAQYPGHDQYPTTITQDSSYMTQHVSQFSVPISGQNQTPSAQNTYVSQNFTNVPTSVQNSPVPQNSSNFAPTSVPNLQTPHHGQSSQNMKNNQGITHFSHPHGLVLVNLKYGKKQIACSGCQETLIGKGYACLEEYCRFQLDESCFNLQKEIQHKSHPAHPLTLLTSSPYNKDIGTCTCNACFRDGSGFTYHCSICQYDLHVKCAILKETVKRDDHEHLLELYYECPLKGEDYTFYCDVCDRVVPRDHWTYYCKSCDYGTHLDCVHRKECGEKSGDPAVDARTNQQRLEEAAVFARISAMGRQNALDNI